MKYLTALTLMLTSVAAFASDLKPFESDGCSSFPEGTVAQDNLWLHCCVQHDLAYWKGGSYEEQLAADQALKECVLQTGESAVSVLMLAGVRVGGTPYLPTTFRWGYGWPYMRGYKELSAAEELLVQKLEEEFIVKRDAAKQ